MCVHDHEHDHMMHAGQHLRDQLDLWDQDQGQDPLKILASHSDGMKVRKPIITINFSMLCLKINFFDKQLEPSKLLIFPEILAQKVA